MRYNCSKLRITNALTLASLGIVAYVFVPVMRVLSTIMKLSTPIELEYSRKNLLALLSYGGNPDQSPYTHKQISEWCERFWNKYNDVDVSEEIEKVMPILADVETQWDLYLANTYSSSQLQELDFETVRLPVEWFKDWSAEANA